MVAIPPASPMPSSLFSVLTANGSSTDRSVIINLFAYRDASCDQPWPSSYRLLP